MISITIDIIHSLFCYNLIVLNTYANYLALHVVFVISLLLYMYLKEMYYTCWWNHGSTK